MSGATIARELRVGTVLRSKNSGEHIRVVEILPNWQLLVQFNDGQRMTAELYELASGHWELIS